MATNLSLHSALGNHGMTIIFAALFHLHYSTGVKGQCDDCWCFPDFNPTTLYCNGLHLYDYPVLSPIISKQLHNIYIFTTNIACLPTLENSELYPSLKTFAEMDNPQWNCSCLVSWSTHLGDQVNFTTGCTHTSHRPDLTETSTSRELSSTFSTLSISSTPLHSSPVSSQTELSRTTPELLTSADYFTANFSFTTQIGSEGEKPNFTLISAYISAAVAAAGVTAATIVAANSFITKIKLRGGPCERCCRRRRLARSTRRLHADTMQLSEMHYAVDEFCSEV